jgi:hypothetical protein
MKAIWPARERPALEDHLVSRAPPQRSQVRPHADAREVQTAGPERGGRVLHYRNEVTGISPRDAGARLAITMTKEHGGLGERASREWHDRDPTGRNRWLPDNDRRAPHGRIRVDPRRLLLVSVGVRRGDGLRIGARACEGRVRRPRRKGGLRLVGAAHDACQTKHR